MNVCVETVGDTMWNNAKCCCDDTQALAEAKGIHVGQKISCKNENNDQTAIGIMAHIWQFHVFFVRFFDGCWAWQYCVYFLLFFPYKKGEFLKLLELI